jgi:hypothetical protein
MRGPVLLGAAVLVASVLLHVRDPHRSGSWGFCPWLVLTGTYCPGCGGLRAVNDLTRGDLAAAASSNLLFVASIPVLVGAWSRSLLRRWRGPVAPVGTRTALVGVALLVTVCVAWWLVRNLPAFSWLAP